MSVTQNSQDMYLGDSSVQLIPHNACCRRMTSVYQFSWGKCSRSFTPITKNSSMIDELWEANNGNSSTHGAYYGLLLLENTPPGTANHRVKQRTTQLQVLLLLLLHTVFLHSTLDLWPQDNQIVSQHQTDPSVMKTEFLFKEPWGIYSSTRENMQGEVNRLGDRQEQLSYQGPLQKEFSENGSRGIWDKDHGTHKTSTSLGGSLHTQMLNVFIYSIPEDLKLATQSCMHLVTPSRL